METKNNGIFACRYGNEPADLKLLLIYFIKRIRYVAYFAIFGTLLFASVYYLKTFVFVQEHQYVATGELYLVYDEDVRLDNVYINDYTWQNLVHTDKAVHHAMSMMKTDVTEEYLRGAVTAGLVSDVRFVTLTVTTEDPELSVEIAQAYQSAIKKLGEEMVDVDTVTVFTEADSAVEVLADDRTLRMACTGAVIGVILGIFIIFMQFIFDDSIYVAGQFERRFGVPVLGVCLKGKVQDINENLIGQRKKNPAWLWNRQVIKLNYDVFTKGYKHIAVADTSLHDKSDLPFVVLKDAKQKLEQDELLSIGMGEIKEEDAFYTSEDYTLIKTASINEDAEGAKECAKADAVILLVQAGAHNGKLLERAMDLLLKQKCNIIAALLYDSDPFISKMYYYEPILFRNENRKNDDEDEDETEDYKMNDLF